MQADPCPEAGPASSAEAPAGARIGPSGTCGRVIRGVRERSLSLAGGMKERRVAGVGDVTNMARVPASGEHISMRPCGGKGEVGRRSCTAPGSGSVASLLLASDVVALAPSCVASTLTTTVWSDASLEESEDASSSGGAFAGAKSWVVGITIPGVPSSACATCTDWRDLACCAPAEKGSLCGTGDGTRTSCTWASFLRTGDTPRTGDMPRPCEV